MHHKPDDRVTSTMSMATRLGQQRIAHTIALAQAFELDPDQSLRKDRQLCKACHYPAKMGGFLAGAAITMRACMCCQEEQRYGSTRTDVLCLECAQQNLLCKHCGADVDLVDRKSGLSLYSPYQG